MTPFEVLGVSRGASLIEIKRAWRSKLLQVHPDVGGSAEETRRVQQAYEDLCAMPFASTDAEAPPPPTASPKQTSRPASSEDIQRLIRDLDEEIAKTNRMMERMQRRAAETARMVSRQQCIATTKKGYPCQSWPVGDGVYCRVHGGTSKTSGTTFQSSQESYASYDQPYKEPFSEVFSFVWPLFVFVGAIGALPIMYLMSVLGVGGYGTWVAVLLWWGLLLLFALYLLVKDLVERFRAFTARRRRWTIAFVAGAMVLALTAFFLSRSRDNPYSGESERFETDQATADVADDSEELLQWLDYGITAVNISADVVDRVVQIAEDADSDFRGWVTGDYASEAAAVSYDAAEMLDKWNERPQPVPDLVAECDSSATELFETTSRIADDFSDMAIDGSTDSDRLDEIVANLAGFNDIADKHLACIEELGM